MGAMGLGSTGMSVSTPTMIESALSTVFAVAISAGGQQSAVLSREGSVFVFGYGGLGLGSQSSAMTPTWISAFASKGIQRIVAGGSHMLALTGTGAVYSWGSGCEGGRGREEGGREEAREREREREFGYDCWEEGGTARHREKK
jgi:alpha-tubulin suppressor-like RCC1 family protein